MTQDFFAWQKEDHYALLGVTRQADAEAIRKAYRRRALECHPDRFGSGTPESQAAHIRFQALTEARDILLDAARRANYDRELELIQQAWLDAAVSQYQVPLKPPPPPKKGFRETLTKAFEEAQRRDDFQRADFVVGDEGATVYSARENEPETDGRGIPAHSKKNAAAYYYAQGMRYAARGHYRRAFYALNNAQNLDPELEIPAQIMHKVRMQAYYSRR